MFVTQDQWSLGRKSTLHRCHFWISVGEQIQNLSRGTSTDFNKSSDHWSIRLLWHRQSGYCNTRRIVKSCLTLSKWRKIDFSVMLYLCGTTTSKTDARPPMDLYSHPSRTPHPQYVVYTWNEYSRVKRVLNCENSWNLAFSQRPACGRIVYRVCGYMAEMKQESSRRPSHVGLLEELQNYINQYEAHEGIQMEPGKIVKNAAKRSLAKLMMNSFWGKFGE